MSQVLFWNPGEVVPHEAVISEREPGTDVARVVLHANGRVGQPSHDVELGASVAAARVVVCTALTGWLSDPGEQHQRAIQLAVGLPSLRHLDTAQVKDLFESWRDRDRWAPAEIVVYGQSVAADRWDADTTTGEWAIVAAGESQVIITAGVGVDAALVQARVVTDWAPYGVDLTRAQTAEQFARSLARLDPDW